MYINVLNLLAKYQENDERLQKKGIEKYQNLCIEEKKKERQYGLESYNDVSNIKNIYIKLIFIFN